MKRHFFLFLIIKLTATTCLISQVNDRPIPRISTNNSSAVKQALLLSPTISYDDVDGSPYLFDEFKYGNIYYSGKHKFEKILLRLNLYNDQLEFKKQDKVMAFGNPVRIDSITMDEEVFTYIPRRSNYKTSGFVKILFSNSPVLFTKMEIKLLRTNVSNNDIDQLKAGQFERIADKYYIKNRHDEIERITTVKKLIRILGRHRSELIKYSRKERISANNPEDLVKLVNYYHELEH